MSLVQPQLVVCQFFSLKKPGSERRLQLLHHLDLQLPFAMASKARVRFKLAQACEKLLPLEAKELYETALDETEIVLLSCIIVW